MAIGERRWGAGERNIQSATRDCIGNSGTKHDPRLAALRHGLSQQGSRVDDSVTLHDEPVRPLAVPVDCILLLCNLRELLSVNTPL